MADSSFKNCKLLISLGAIFIFGCVSTDQPEYTSELRQIGETAESQVMQHPRWSHNTVGYLVNLQDQSLSGDLNGLTADLDRLNNLGIDVIILQPLFPGNITQDSVVFDYKAYTSFLDIDEEYGTLQDFSELISEAHSRGIRVLLSWPTGQLALNHEWRQDAAQIFIDDSLKQYSRPLWADVASVDHGSDTTLSLTAECWQFWVKIHKVDGFYCLDTDLAPLVFWEQLRTRVESGSKPLFLASEISSPDYHHNAFDMTCAMELVEVMQDIALKGLPPEAIDIYLKDMHEHYPLNSYRKLFLNNSKLSHAKGSIYDQYGRMHRLFGILSFTLGGVPVMFTGQEADETQRYQLYVKDTINFENAHNQKFYKQLISAHHENEALWSGLSGGRYRRLSTTKDEHLFAFSRTKGENQVIVILNFSDEPQEVHFNETIDGTFNSIFNNQLLSIFTEGDVKLPPFGYQVFVK